MKVDTFAWRQNVFKVLERKNVVLALNCGRNFCTYFWNPTNIFSYSLCTAVHQLGKSFGKLSFVGVPNIILNVQSKHCDEMGLRQFKCPSGQVGLSTYSIWHNESL